MKSIFIAALALLPTLAMPFVARAEDPEEVRRLKAENRRLKARIAELEAAAKPLAESGPKPTRKSDAAGRREPEGERAKRGEGSPFPLRCVNRLSIRVRARGWADADPEDVEKVLSSAASSFRRCPEGWYLHAPEEHRKFVARTMAVFGTEVPRDKRKRPRRPGNEK